MCPRYKSSLNQLPGPSRKREVVHVTSHPSSAIIGKNISIGQIIPLLFFYKDGFGIK